MTPSCLVITAADAKYFDLAQGCIQSVRDQCAAQGLKLAFLDLGCTEEHLAWVHSRADFVRQPAWEFEFPGRDQIPGYLRGFLCRPFLRKYFPGFDVYLWIDADAWVQNGQVVELFIRGAQLRRGLAIVPEIDRGSNLQYGNLPGYWNEVQSWYAMSYGLVIARDLCHYPMCNAGVFALHADAPHWAGWENTLRESLQKTCTTITDQIALNFVIYRGRTFKLTEFLPAWCNWTCHFGMPRWDESRACLVEPYLPHTPIGILHLTVEKHEQYRVGTTEGKEIDVRLRYPAGVIRS